MVEDAVQNGILWTRYGAVQFYESMECLDQLSNCQVSDKTLPVIKIINICGSGKIITSLMTFIQLQ
jgi:hypothetical protein